MDEVLAYVAAGLVGLWGVAHAVPTRQVVAGFGPITVDNRRVLLQEWLAEAFTHGCQTRRLVTPRLPPAVEGQRTSVHI